MFLFDIGLLFVCIVLNSNYGLAENSYCSAGGECSNDELNSIVLDLQREARQAELLARSNSQNCTACFSDPCQNGGVCIPEENNHYRCDCPFDTTGTNCEIPLQCLNNSCGPNATCYVAHHEINCACKLGFDGGDPYTTGCPLKVVTRCFTGDPHFITFDDLNYDYQGTCPFVVCEPCHGVITGYPAFSVRAVNERSYDASTTARTASAQLITYGIDIRVNRNRSEFLVNGVRTTMPYYLGNESDWRISAKQMGGGAYILIETDYNLKIEFNYDHWSFCLTIPDISAFRGPETLCGLAGNLDGNCENDLRLRNGTVLPATPKEQRCHMDVQSLISEEFGDDWIVPNQDHGCILGTVLFNTTLPCDAQVLTDAGVTCQPIADALNAVGFFSRCQGMGAAEIDRHFRHCQWSLCAPPQGMQYAVPAGSSRKCTSFTEFVHACQRDIPGTVLGEWRKGLACPIYCPSPSSTYSECAIGCPGTCAVHGGPANCSQPCAEGCSCNSGYVFQDGLCTALGDCRCFDGSSVHQANSVWYTQNCTVRNECHAGSVTNYPMTCDSNAVCAVGVNEHCVCNTGYTGDGVTCVDIDECLNNTLCGQAQAQGSCTNTNGSYSCTCNPNYDGAECQRFHPRRHCADLYTVQNDTVSGIKTIYPSFAFNGVESSSPLTVYCDMEMDGGGWTAFTGPDGNSTVGKTYAEYERGFGDVTANDYWQGLAYLHGATHEFVTTLHIKLGFCTGHNVDWTYPEFKVLNAENRYAPVMNVNGSGSAGEGWMMNWPERRGPAFSGIDNCQTVGAESATTCCSVHGNTGWWFDSYMCGMANLNGIRFSCDYLTANTNTEQSIVWNFQQHPKSAQMLLRPKDYPDYDK